MTPKSPTLCKKLEVVIEFCATREGRDKLAMAMVQPLLTRLHNNMVVLKLLKQTTTTHENGIMTTQRYSIPADMNDSDNPIIRLMTPSNYDRLQELTMLTISASVDENIIKLLLGAHRSENDLDPIETLKAMMGSHKGGSFLMNPRTYVAFMQGGSSEHVDHNTQIDTLRTGLMGSFPAAYDVPAGVTPARIMISRHMPNEGTILYIPEGRAGEWHDTLKVTAETPDPGTLATFKITHRLTFKINIGSISHRRIKVP